MKPMYVIRPLEWEGYATDRFSAATIFGNITIMRDFDGWSYSWCFDEIYDEGRVRCDSRDDVFAEAEAFYLSRLIPALAPAPSKEDILQDIDFVLMSAEDIAKGDVGDLITEARGKIAEIWR